MVLNGVQMKEPMRECYSSAILSEEFMNFTGFLMVITLQTFTVQFHQYLKNKLEALYSHKY